jgi:hypothetical protein
MKTNCEKLWNFVQKTHAYTQCHDVYIDFIWTYDWTSDYLIYFVEIYLYFLKIKNET